MAKGVFIVESNAIEGQDDAYNEWYNGTHLGELCDIPGIVRGRRYLVHDGAVPADPSRRKYVAIYEIEADDLSLPIKELFSRGASGNMSRPVGLETDPPPVMAMYELIAEAEAPSTR